MRILVLLGWDPRLLGLEANLEILTEVQRCETSCPSPQSEQEAETQNEIVNEKLKLDWLLGPVPDLSLRALWLSASLYTYSVVQSTTLSRVLWDQKESMFATCLAQCLAHGGCANLSVVDKSRIENTHKDIMGPQMSPWMGGDIAKDLGPVEKLPKWSCGWELGLMWSLHAARVKVPAPAPWCGWGWVDRK